MKIKKGTIIIYILAIMLVTAGYWNYISEETETIATVNVDENTVEEQLGDATLVSSNELIEEEEYFEESKISRETMYSQTLETYQSILNNSNVSEEQKAIVTQEITKLNQEKNAIMICENLISTKGFEDCVIFVNLESISIIIKSENLTAEEIAQVQNIISREMGAKVENIHIMTK